MRPDFEPTTPKKTPLAVLLKCVRLCGPVIVLCMYVSPISLPLCFGPQDSYIETYLSIYTFIFPDACVFKRGSPAKQIYFLLGSFLSWQTFFIDISDSFISSACVRTFTFLPSFFYIFHFISFLLFSFLFRLSVFCLRWKQKKTTTVIMAIIKKVLTI